LLPGQNDERVKLLIFGHITMEITMNRDGTTQDISAEAVPQRRARKQLHAQRRKARGDETRYEAIRLLLDMQKHGAAPAFMARQMRIVNRVRVQAGSGK
jgi:hypothetical protein